MQSLGTSWYHICMTVLQQECEIKEQNMRITRDCLQSHLRQEHWPHWVASLDVQHSTQLKRAGSHLCPAAQHKSFQLFGSACSMGLTKGFGSNISTAMLNSQLDASFLPKKGDGLKQHQSAFWKADCWRISRTCLLRAAQERSSCHSLVLCPTAVFKRRLTKHLENAVMLQQQASRQAWSLRRRLLTASRLPKILS